MIVRPTSAAPLVWATVTAAAASGCRVGYEFVGADGQMSPSGDAGATLATGNGLVLSSPSLDAGIPSAGTRNGSGTSGAIGSSVTSNGNGGSGGASSASSGSTSATAGSAGTNGGAGASGAASSTTAGTGGADTAGGAASSGGADTSNAGASMGGTSTTVGGAPSGGTTSSGGAGGTGGATCVSENGCSCDTHAGNDYWFCTTRMIWDDANAHCATAGMQLVSINAPEEDAFVFDGCGTHGLFAVNNQVLTGGFRGTAPMDTDKWFWVDGTTFWSQSTGDIGEHSNWSMQSPRGSSQLTRTSILDNGLWLDTGPANDRPFVCERP